MDKQKALIAMSGGVDSSVAAALMLEAGYDCIGGNMFVCLWNNKITAQIINPLSSILFINGNRLTFLQSL